MDLHYPPVDQQQVQSSSQRRKTHSQQSGGRSRGLHMGRGQSRETSSWCQVWLCIQWHQVSWSRGRGSAQHTGSSGWREPWVSDGLNFNLQFRWPLCGGGVRGVVSPHFCKIFHHVFSLCQPSERKPSSEHQTPENCVKFRFSEGGPKINQLCMLIYDD